MFGIKRADKVKVTDLLQKANALSVEQMCGQALLSLAWNTLKFGKNQLQYHIKEKKPDSNNIVLRSQSRGDLVIHNYNNRYLVTMAASQLFNSCSVNIRDYNQHKSIPKNSIKSYVKNHL